MICTVLTCTLEPMNSYYDKILTSQAPVEQSFKFQWPSLPQYWKETYLFLCFGCLPVCLSIHPSVHPFITNHCLLCNTSTPGSIFKQRGTNVYPIETVCRAYGSLTSVQGHSMGSNQLAVFPMCSQTLQLLEWFSNNLLKRSWHWHNAHSTQSVTSPQGQGHTLSSYVLRQTCFCIRNNRLV